MKRSLLRSITLISILTMNFAYSYDVCKKHSELCSTFEIYDIADSELDETVSKDGIKLWYEEELKPFMDKAIIKKYKNSLATKFRKPVFEYFIINGKLPELSTKEELWAFSKFVAKFNRLRSVQLDIIEFSIIRWNLTGYYNKN